MNSLETSMSHLDGDPSILPFSVIPNQIPGRPNFACGQIVIEYGKPYYWVELPLLKKQR